MDSTETSKLLAQRISQLEHDAAGEKDQEAEIGACLLFFLERRYACGALFAWETGGVASKLSHAHSNARLTRGRFTEELHFNHAI